ncbi:LysE family transporter [Pyrobaculum ferrireducens]|uniref:Lysine exporter protein (LYSE/YGGA) n=1 Tax=Pyrobaculum ferrireducens TaxID=1104324 RepID=G7VDM1_9CREN|nr:LysE family transporter [Pyrobaculum ferrireducens]AET34000.1 Lysine exporter protein (LYSE/YGGA) [Pyrobaculum ferrireducens]
MGLGSLLSGLMLGYSLAVPPGPMNALIAAWSLRGFRYGFAVGAGAMSADFLLMVLTIALYSRLKALGAEYFTPFYIAGGAFFLYLAYKIFKSRPPGRREGGGGSPARGYLLGLTLGLINPYQVGWWLTAGLSSIAQFGVEWAAGLFTAILTWITTFPAAVRAGWELSSRATWLAIKIFSVATLLFFGVYFLIRAAGVRLPWIS